jgi:exopolyphosphatase/guanosine-5'-triphosphate,3'-diphosphate pyrophosphatase
MLLYSRFVSEILPDRAEILDMENFCRTSLITSAVIENYQVDSMFGIGGGVRATFKLARQLDLLDAPVHGRQVMTPAQLDSVFDTLLSDRGAFAHAAVKVVPERLHTCIPGAVCLRVCMREFGVKQCTLSTGGVREGYLVAHVIGA